MDSLGAVHIAITAIQMLTQLNSVYSGVSNSAYLPPKKILSELPILISLLHEIQSNASNSCTEPPPTVSVALQISVERFQELIDCLMDMGLDPMTGQALPGKRHKMQRVVQMVHWTNTGQLQESTKRFRSALTLLRDIAMDHRTHDLITQQRAFLRYEFDYIRKCLRNPPGTTSTDNLAEDVFSENLDDDSGPVNGQLPFRFSPGSGSLFSITFSLDVPDGERPLFYPARAKYDTGCPDCLLSEAIIRKHNLERWLQTSDTERRYTGLGNVEVVSKSQICLKWSANNETISRQNTFYVVPDSPFELLLGEYFMNENSPLLPALPIRLLNGKSKAQKKIEAAKEAEDNRRGAELAVQRRKGKAVLKPINGAVVTTAGSSPTSPVQQQSPTKQLQTPPPSPIQERQAQGQIQDPPLRDHGLTTSPVSRSITPRAVESVVRQEPEPTSPQITSDSIGSELQKSKTLESNINFYQLRENALPHAQKPPDEKSIKRPLPITTGSETQDKPISTDSGYISDVPEPGLKSRTTSGLPERGSVKKRRAKEEQSVSEKATKDISSLSNVHEEHTETVRRRWALWR